VPITFNGRAVDTALLICPIGNNTKIKTFSREQFIKLSEKFFGEDDCKEPRIGIWYSNGTLYRLTYQVSCKGALEFRYFTYAITFNLVCKDNVLRK